MGPLTEVIAQNHQWSELSEFLQPSPTSTYIAYECGIRGQQVDSELFPALESPCSLLPIETNYALAEYHDNEAKFPTPAIPEMGNAIAVPTSSAHVVHDSDASTAFHQLVDAWTTQSNGELRISCVEGSVLDALAALEVQEARLSLLTSSDALAWLTWAGASGGAHGKRRGAATGRGEAWWFLATFVGLADDWPCDPDEIGDIVNSLEFTAFTYDKTPTGGWGLHLVIEDPEEGLAIALRATDND